MKRDKRFELKTFAVLVALCAFWSSNAHAQIPHDEFLRSTSKWISGCPACVVSATLVDGWVAAERMVDALLGENDGSVLQQSDLQAQWAAALAAQRAARSAEEQTTLAWWQLIISAIGSGLVILTIAVSGLSLKQAQQAIRVSRELGQAQIRAYLSWHQAGYGTSVTQDGNLYAVFLKPIVSNTGQSPGHILRMSAHIDVHEVNSRPEARFDPLHSGVNSDVGAGNTFEMVRCWISAEDALLVYNGTKEAHLFGWGEYRDVFQTAGDTPHQFRFCFKVSLVNPPSVENNLLELHAVTEYDYLAIQDDPQ